MKHLLLACLLVAIPLSEAAAQRRSTELVCAWRDPMRPGASGTCRSFRSAGMHRIGRACTCTTAGGARAGRIAQRRPVRGAGAP